jgi:ABC-type transporter Mla maintaining outer membrane lipid asymmetry ATPase subunit MlaF
LGFTLLNPTQIKLDGLSYIQENEEILKSITYKFMPNRTTGILAPVEEKMSTLLKIIGGITAPTRGSVIINGLDMFRSDRKTLKEVRKNLAFVFERKGILSNLSISENLLLPLNFHYPDTTDEEKQNRIDKLFDHFGIHKKILSERPARLHPQTLKMILLIRAFIMKPEIILYDNPLTDLELTLKKAVSSYIKQLKESKKVTQIFFSTSRILFNDADYVLVFSGGTLIEQGQVDSIMKSENPLTKNIIHDYLEAGSHETQI